MTSKRELRERLQDALDRNRDAWDEGYTKGFTYAASLAVGDPRPWAAHLARVADAAREQGRREGYRKALADIAADVALLRDMDHQPQPETTPEHANACGCDCACASIPKPWTPGNVRP